MASKYLHNPEFHARVKALHEAGRNLTQISRELGVSLDTVRRVSALEGLTYDRTMIAAAIQAKQVDNRARRAAITDRLYGLAEAQITRLEAGQYEHRISAGPNSFVVTDTVPNADEVRNHTQAIYSAIAAAKQLESIDVDPGAAAARSTLAAIGQALGIEKRE